MVRGLHLKVFPACRKYLEIGDFDSIMGPPIPERSHENGWKNETY
jgi:hypothetical protein